MAKEQLKRRIAEENDNHDTITGEELPDETRLYDTHRTLPKRKGGTYTKKNTGVVIPLTHMKEHGTLRVREEELNTLKSMMDDRRQFLKLLLKINNQLLAYKRFVDDPLETTIEALQGYLKNIKSEFDIRDKEVIKFVKKMIDPLAKAALSVKSVGPITVANCLVYIDLNKADHASSLWKYAGLHTPSYNRYDKSEANKKGGRGGNKTLRTALYIMADSQVKGNGAYRNIYDMVKSRLEKSNKIVKSRNTKGDLVEVAWKDTKPCHRHGAALRAVMKHFLADYWFVGRTLLGLPTNPLYAEAVLGSGHKTIDPRFRGWKFDEESKPKKVKRAKTKKSLN